MRSALQTAIVLSLSIVGLTGCDTDDPALAEEGAPLIVADGGLPRRSYWRFWDRGGDQGTAWRGPTDPNWPAETAPFGYGESYVRTIGYGPDPANKYITSYFWTQFTVADASAVLGMQGDLMYDDGVVVYLNGHEIARPSMPSGAITASTRALGHETGNAYEPHDWTAFRDRLVSGVNTIAVEVHQADPGSSDLAFDLGVTLRVAAADRIARGASWHYWDRGGSPGTGWATPAHDDASWSIGAGPLGYGESYLATTVGYGPSAAAKHVTTYFRRELTVTDPGAITRVVGEVMYDDGVVVYLNGHELARPSMPVGPITPTTYALGHEAGNVYATFDWTAYRGLLVAGTNVIAVEVHQADAASSDLVFDLALTIERAPPPPALAYRIDRGSIWRYWDRGYPVANNWKQLGFDDATWAQGAGPLGYGESYLATTVGYGANPAQKHVTTYFRKQFLVEDSPSVVVQLTGELMYDDGVVVYLNGVELARRAMPTGPIGFYTRSSGHETGNAYEVYDWRHATSLQPGENVIAVEVHQASPSSSDLVFDLSLDVRAVPTFTKYASNPVIAASPTPTPPAPYFEEVRRDPTVVHLPDGSWVMFYTDNGPIFDEKIYRAVSADGVTWTPTPATPVWRGFQPAVLFDGTTYRMWHAMHYEGVSSAIHLATSTDGITWTAIGPVLDPTTPGWEASIFNPAVIRDGDRYEIWYESLHESQGNYHLGHATSTDGVIWTRRPTPVTVTNLTTTETFLGDVSVIKEHGDYKMWFSAINRHIMYATSRDGLHWTMWPVVSVSRSYQAGAWDELIRMGAVVRDGDTLRLWYFGSAQYNGYDQIGYATHP